MIISENELIRSKTIKLYYGNDPKRIKKKTIEFDRIVLIGIHKIMIDGFTLRFLSKRGKEKAKIVLKIGEYLDIDEKLGTYKVINKI